VTEFKLPELGENIEQGDLVRLMIAPGADIKEGQPVMELETDKAVIEVPSSVSGTVREIRVKEGDKLKVGQVIFTVENGAGGSKEASLEAPHPPVTAPRKSDAGATNSGGGAAGVPARPAVEAAKPPKEAPVQPAAAAKPQPSAPSSSVASEFKLPELGENIDQGDLVRLMITPGTKVSEGQPVMELETDKAVVEVPSSVSGVVKEIRVKEGDKVKVGQVIFTLEGGAQPPTKNVS